MVETPVDPPRRVVALHPCVLPALRHAAWFGVFLLVAPAVGPRGYGLFFLAFSGIAIAEAVLAEAGCAALVGLGAVEDRHWSTALVTMMAAGGAAWLLLYPVAGLVGAMTTEPALPDMVRSLAILPLLGALGVVPRAALHRERREVALAAAEIAGFAAGAGIAVALAWAGTGPWSLVAQVIVQRLVECVVLWGAPGERIGLAWSRRHFDELLGALRRRALPGVWSAISVQAPCLVVGLILGPTATGLYLFALRLAAALPDIFLAGPAGDAPRARGERACRAVLPVLLASALLPVALPPVIDPRWWGAIWPAQIMLLGAIPGALAALCGGLRGDDGAWRGRATQELGAVVVLAAVAGEGLGAAAAAQVGAMALAALAGLWSCRYWLRANGRALLAGAARPCGGAAVAGILLFALANPVGLTLAPVPALCLLTAGGWLVYLVIRGEPATPARALFTMKP